MGRPIIILGRPQRASFKETHPWEQESLVLELNFLGLACTVRQLRLHPSQGG